MLDSGASGNFISHALFQTLGIGLQSQNQHTVRLADGKVLKTLGQVSISVLFGGYHWIGQFNVLDCKVPLILGMDFLNKVGPKIDFQERVVSVLHKGVQYRLPTCVVDSKNGENKCVQQVVKQKFADRNQFADLDIEGIDADSESLVDEVLDDLDVGSDVADVAAESALQVPSKAGNCLGSGFSGCKSSCKSVCKGCKSKQLRSKECQQCNRSFVGVGRYCLGCSDSIFEQFGKNDHDLKNDLGDHLNVELCNYKQFVRYGRKMQYKLLGVVQLEPQREADQYLNFTHRATLGGGDDADAQQGELSSLSKQQLDYLKNKYAQVFSEPTYPVDRSGCPNAIEHRIPLVDENAPPPKRKLYPLDQKELEELKQQLRDFLDSGRVEVANGAYGAPILFAKKKDGGLRMCIDYRALNGQTMGDYYPLPRLDELLQRLDGAAIFSKLDMRDGYHQIPMAVEDRVKTSFTCRYGTYQFTVMPFGLSTAPSTFQRMMNNVFFELLDNGVLCYLDDLLIYSKTIDEHIVLLDRVFSILEKNKLYIKEKKCHLFLEKVNFLGHVVSKDGIAMESGKVEVVKKWPVPQTVNQVQQFLGLCNYYRRFVLRFSEIASPLTLLTRKNQKFEWGERQQKAFECLKRVLCEAPVLKVFDPKLHTRVVCDASNFCVGSVLEQQDSAGAWHPVEYYSKRLSTSERNYSATDREYVAIRQSLERWRHFLVGKKFIILTDHVALTYLQSSATVSRRNARWLDFLSQFTFDIQHIKGKENVVADTLSRIPGSEVVSSLQLCSCNWTLGVEHVDDLGADVYSANWLSNIITIHENKSFLQQLLQEQQLSKNIWFLDKVELAKKGSELYQFRNGILCKLVRDTFCPILPDWQSSSVQVVLSDLHNSALGGHLGYKKMLKLCQFRFYFQNMCRAVDTFVKHCEVCAANKHSTQRPGGLLQPLENPSSPFQHVTMDFVTNLPVSNRGFDAIFSIVDRFSRMCKFIPCKTSISALEVADLFFEQWVCKFGMPTKIISDRDVKFTSGFWQQLMGLLQCRVALSTSYHPQTDGLTERFHRSIEQVLRCYCSGQQEQWCQKLSQAEFALNSTHQEAVQNIPFKIVFGFVPKLPIDVQLSTVQLPAVSDFVSSRAQVQQQVQASLQEAQARMVASADRLRRHVQFEVGDKVWLSTKNLPLKSQSRKLSALWAGPFEVSQIVGSVAYKLILPQSWGVHNVFHVSQLKAVKGQIVQQQEIQVDGQAEFEVEKIVDSRLNRGVRQYLVKWLGYGDFENEWLDASELGNAQELVSQYWKFFGGTQRTRRGSGVMP